MGIKRLERVFKNRLFHLACCATRGIPFHCIDLVGRQQGREQNPHLKTWTLLHLYDIQFPFLEDKYLNGGWGDAKCSEILQAKKSNTRKIAEKIKHVVPR
jgi:hypothetical protein